MPPSPEPSTLVNDIVVDGFIAHTFSARDAEHYFAHLFRTPDFLQVYHISYSQGVWRVTDQDALFIEWPLSRGLIKGSPASPPVDFDVRATQGTVVPQRRRPTATRGGLGYFAYQNDSLQLPIFFVHQNGGVGFSLSDILQGRDSGLYNGDKAAPLEDSMGTFIRISWPGYADWGQQIQTRDGTYFRNRITLARFMKAVGGSVEEFLNMPIANRRVVDPRWDPRWRIGVDGLTQNDVKIIGAVNVSPDSWMPIIQLISHVL